MGIALIFQLELLLKTRLFQEIYVSLNTNFVATLSMMLSYNIFDCILGFHFGLAAYFDRKGLALKN